MTITARTASKVCVRTRSECPEIFFLVPISREFLEAYNLGQNINRNCELFEIMLPSGLDAKSRNAKCSFVAESMPSRLKKKNENFKCFPIKATLSMFPWATLKGKPWCALYHFWERLLRLSRCPTACDSGSLFLLIMVFTIFVKFSPPTPSETSKNQVLEGLPKHPSK